MDDIPAANEEHQPAAPAPVLNYRTNASDRLTTLCHMPVMQAELAKVKLQAEGVVCFVTGTAAASHPGIGPQVPLLVREEEVEAAREILARPAEDVADGDYADESWRCPHCHRKTVELLPLSRGRRWAQTTWWILFVLPIVLLLLPSATGGDEKFRRSIEHAMAVGWAPWMLLVLVLTVVVIGSPRRKRCRECGREWKSQ